MPPLRLGAVCELQDSPIAIICYCDERDVIRTFEREIPGLCCKMLQLRFEGLFTSCFLMLSEACGKVHYPE